MARDDKWLRLVAGQLPAILWTTDTRLQFTTSLGADLAHLGMEVGEAVGRSLVEFFASDPTEQDRAVTMHRRALAGESVTYEQRWGGRHYLSRVDPLRDERDRIVGCIGVAQDITDRVEVEQRLRHSQTQLRQHIADRTHDLEQATATLAQERGHLEEAETALRESEALFRAISEQLPEALYLFDPDDPEVPGKILHVNQVAARDRGWSVQELVGRSVLELADDATAAQAPAFFKRIKLDGTAHFEGGHRRKDGSSYPVEIIASRIRYRNRDVILGLARDITEQREARRSLEAEVAEREQVAAALRGQTEILHSILDSIPEGVVVADQEGKFLLWNASATRQVGLGITDAPVEQWSQTYHLFEADGKTVYNPEQLPLARAIRGESLDEVPVLVRRPGEDEMRHLSVSARPIVDGSGRSQGGVAVFRDVTDVRRAQERSRQHEAEMAHMARLSTLGEMASGLAHELNQPLAAIANYVHGCRQRLEDDLTDRAQLDLALAACAKQAQRAGDIVGRVRTFARKPKPSRAATSINEVVVDAVALLELDARRHGIVVQLELVDHLPLLNVDRIQIEQVVVNLLRNAIEAMRDDDSDERRVIVSTGDHDESVVVGIRDFGPGLGPGTRDRMFEPFFTTKRAGLGIGLKICQSIADAHEGRLEARNHPDGGCVFRFFLPSREDLTRGDADVE